MPGNVESVMPSMDKDIYRSPIDGYIYNFSGYAGITNCSDCDAFTQVNEYDREDRHIFLLCKNCENKHHL